MKNIGQEYKGAPALYSINSIWRELVSLGIHIFVFRAVMNAHRDRVIAVREGVYRKFDSNPPTVEHINYLQEKL